MHAAFGGQGEGGSELGPLHTVPQTPAGGLRSPAPLLLLGEIRSSLLHG